MRRKRFLSCLFALAAAAPLTSGMFAEEADKPTQFKPEDVKFFENDVKPILETRCFKCHGGGKKLRGDFRITSRSGLLRGGELGPAIDLESPESSSLIEAINYDGLEMPPTGRLPGEEIEILTRWVKLGAPWTPGEAEPEPAKRHEFRITEDDRNYWAYRRVDRPDLPAVQNEAWVRGPIDRFILARLEAAGLSPAPPAAKIALLRRVYYDLIGLPPTPAEVDAFLKDTNDDAYEQVVERLLESPHYGEKWGRHWLDLVRYAETNGYERDGDKPQVWRYRDYVIRSFNEDKPYDRFIMEQLAGDELPDSDHAAKIATGYHRLWLWDDEPVDREQAYFDALDDVVSTTSQVFLGMTIGCARCHDHKIDPIPQTDYYRMLAFFSNTDRRGGRRFDYLTLAPVADPAQAREFEQQKHEHEAQIRGFDETIRKFEDKIFATFSNPEKEDAKDGRTRGVLLKQKRDKALSPAERDEYVKALGALDQLKKTKLKPLPMALVIQENGRQAPATHVLIRGNAHAQGDEVQPGFPEVLGMPDPELPEAPVGVPSSGRRTALARWIASGDNPLTARVMANRIWQHHFGRGLAETTSDFGNAGIGPTHPLLLDWLATEFVRQGWSIKQMHRLILLSNTYRMASTPNEAALARDPQNRLFWRFNMRRLTAEELRDSILTVTGELNPKMFGPSVFPPLPPEVLATASRPGAAWGQSSPEDAVRRSIYIKVKRSLRHPMLTAFDAADTDSTCPVRFATTVPTQALSMLNSEFSNRSAAKFAKRLASEAPGALAAQVRLAIRLTTSREASEEEVAADVKFIESMKTAEGVDDARALAYYCLLTLNLNEFVYLD